jgi:hypothetical protein
MQKVSSILSPSSNEIFLSSSTLIYIHHERPPFQSSSSSNYKLISISFSLIGGSGKYFILFLNNNIYINSNFSICNFWFFFILHWRNSILRDLLKAYLSFNTETPLTSYIISFNKTFSWNYYFENIAIKHFYKI